MAANRVVQILKDSQVQLLADWVKALRASQNSRTSTMLSDPELQAQCQEFLTLLGPSIASGSDDIHAESWRSVRDFLSGVSRSRTRQGFSPSETAQFVFSLKEPMFAHLRRAFEGRAPVAVDHEGGIPRALQIRITPRRLRQRTGLRR